MSVHLLQRHDLDAFLLDVEYKVAKSLMFCDVPIGARQQQRVLCVMSAGGPNLLPVYDPLVTFLVGARCGTRQVRSAARFAEQLAPSVLAGQDTAQKLLFMQLVAMH